MSTTGLSKSRLDRLHHVLSEHIHRNAMPGLVAHVSRHDEVYIDTRSTLSFEQPTPMKRDTIYRIASLSKVITAVAAMMLVEECRLRLDDSIEPGLPWN
jgi:CubicO group peptidase (beta-lactamase class C family)